MGYDATLIYQEEWETKLQEMLDEPNKWKDICRVEYTNSKVLNNPYLTDATVQTGTRGTQYSMQAINETNESITINTYKTLNQFIDRADLAQSQFTTQMEIATRQGILLNKSIENAVLGAYTQMTDFGSGDVAGTSTGDTTQITVSITNIDDIILAMLKTIEVASGQDLIDRNGAFIVWRPADFMLLKSFMMANGFSTADQALKNGVSSMGGIDYMGITHYSSNQLTANHVVGGIKKVLHLGIVKDTYGQVVVVQDPMNTSGISVNSRVDYAVKVWTKTQPVLFDINVAS